MSWQEEFVTVINNTGEDIEWDGLVYNPGKKRTVPFLSMANSFGDPRSVNGSHMVYRAPDGTQGVVQPRAQERIRVQTVWINQPWDEIPSLEFFSMDGDRIYTVRDDPTGDKIMPANTSVEHQRDLEETVRRQQRQINDLLNLAGLDADALPTDDSAGIPADIPSDESTADQTQSPFAHAEAE